jgi:hypothetical protein
VWHQCQRLGEYNSSPYPLKSWAKDENVYDYNKVSQTALATIIAYSQRSLILDLIISLLKYLSFNFNNYSDINNPFNIWYSNTIINYITPDIQHCSIVTFCCKIRTWMSRFRIFLALILCFKCFMLGATVCVDSPSHLPLII